MSAVLNVYRLESAAAGIVFLRPDEQPSDQADCQPYSAIRQLPEAKAYDEGNVHRPKKNHFYASGVQVGPDSFGDCARYQNPLRPQPYHSHPILQMLHGLPQWNEATAQEPVRRQQHRRNHRYEEQDSDPVFRPPPDILLGVRHHRVLLFVAIPAEPLCSGQVAAAGGAGRRNRTYSIANKLRARRLPRRLHFKVEDRQSDFER